jgi:hypothetical protein
MNKMNNDDIDMFQFIDNIKHIIETMPEVIFTIHHQYINIILTLFSPFIPLLINSH